MHNYTPWDAWHWLHDTLRKSDLSSMQNGQFNKKEYEHVYCFYYTRN